MVDKDGNRGARANEASRDAFTATYATNLM